MEFNLINVGIADFSVSAAPDILRTILGSCVGVCLYDHEKKIGGLCHIMLPSLKGASRSDKKYADRAIPMMLGEMEERGVDRRRVTAKVAGGSTMFNVSENSLMSEIGNNNIKRVREVLGELGITSIAEDTGGNYGRTIDFHLDSGIVKIRSMGREEKIL